MISRIQHFEHCFSPKTIPPPLENAEIRNTLEKRPKNISPTGVLSIKAIPEFAWYLDSRSLVRAGDYSLSQGGIPYNQGTNGYYWESKANNSTYAYNLNFNSTNLNPQNSDGTKGIGRSIRCLIYFLFSPISAPPTLFLTF